MALAWYKPSWLADLQLRMSKLTYLSLYRLYIHSSFLFSWNFSIKIVKPKDKLEEYSDRSLLILLTFY